MIILTFFLYEYQVKKNDQDQKRDSDEENEFLTNLNLFKLTESTNQEKLLKESFVSIFFISNSIFTSTLDRDVSVSETSKNEIIIELFNQFDQSTLDSSEQRTKNALTSHDIASKVDESNILFQGIKRSKRKKQHYDDQLNQTLSKIIDAFHLFFGVHFFYSILSS